MRIPANLCTISGGKRCNPCEALVLLEKKIKDTLNDLQQLQTTALELKSQWNRQHDLLINRLPTELLGRIFTQLLPFRLIHRPSTFFLPLICGRQKHEPLRWAPCTKKPSTSWTLSAVCPAWRDVVHSTPQMWTSIIVNLQQQEKGYPEFVDEQLLRSGALPVWLTLYQPMDKYGLSPLPHNILRLLDIHLCRKPGSTASLLQHIQVQQDYSDFVAGRLNSATVTDATFSPATVCFKNISFGAIGISWHRVTHVEASSILLEWCLALFRGAQAMTHLTFKSLRLDDERPSVSSNPIVHTALRALKIGQGRCLDRLLDALLLPSLEEIHIGMHDMDPDPLTDLIIRSGCHLERLTVFSNSDPSANNENKLIRLLEHTPSLLALALVIPFITDVLFRHLGPPTLEATPTSADTNEQGPVFLPLLHTLVIRVFINFEWHSVANMFGPCAGSLGSARQALKVFELQIYGDDRDSAPDGPLIIDGDATSRLLAVRENGVDVRIFDEDNRDMLRRSRVYLYLDRGNQSRTAMAPGVEERKGLPRIAVNGVQST
ncbi:unnamed protein product [Cyclocybe aegerita]|uniref:F-box domain-containing protein n=1 Tax=Cyclocybe aegerita TaxID=1973307 RepID=A0A8S0XSN0_CYCAE|nr:unnamed protein product [Cyclocybe aegerita]